MQRILGSFIINLVVIKKSYKAQGERNVEEKLYKEAYEEGYKDGYAVGYRVIAKIAIIKILSQKFGDVPKDILEYIEKENDEKKLDLMEDCALDSERILDFKKTL